MFYLYEETLFNGANVYSQGGVSIADQSVCSGTVSFPKWSALCSHQNVPRGILRGVPSTATEKYESGCFSYMDSGEIPVPRKTTYADIHRKAGSKLKTFRRAARTGEILLNPILHSDIEVVVHPGVVRPVSNSYQYLTLPTNTKSPDLLDPVNPCTGGFSANNGWFDSLSGIPLDQKVWGYRIGSPNVRRRWNRIQNPVFLWPDSDLIKPALSVVEEFLARDWDTGLITSSLAEANSEIWDFMTELGEAKETVGFIMGTLRQIVQLIVDTRQVVSRVRKDIKDPRKVADEITSLWLQFRYAVMPMVYSVNDAMDYFHSSFTPYNTVRQGQSVISPATDLFDGWVISDFEAIDRCYVKSQIGRDTLTRGLKMNPFSTAWELVPLSFIVDWVLNIGDFLTSLDDPGALIYRGVQYSRQVRERSIIVRHRSDPYLGHISINFRYYKAEPINPLDHIGLQVSLSMSWKRWLDAISLSWGFTRSLLKSFGRG